VLIPLPKVRRHLANRELRIARQRIAPIAGERQCRNPAPILRLLRAPGRHRLIDLTLRGTCRLKPADDLVRHPQEAPILIEGEVIDAISSYPVIAVVRCSYSRRDRQQMGRGFNRRLPLSNAEIGSARRADFAVGPRLRRGPLNGVIAVVLLLKERCISAFRSHGATNLLQYTDVALLRPCGDRRPDHPCKASVSKQSTVWVPNDYDRIFAGRLRFVNLRIELHTIAHRNHRGLARYPR